MTRRAYVITPLLLTVALLCSTNTVSHAQDCSTPPSAMIVLDRSTSIGTLEWNNVRDGIKNLVNAYEPQIRFGLMLFPKYKESSDLETNPSCTGGVVNVSMGGNNAQEIANLLNGVNTFGSTPMASSLQTAKNALGSSGDRFVILLTDGYESCSGDAVGAVQRLTDAGIKTFVACFTEPCDPRLAELARRGGVPNPKTTDGIYVTTGAAIGPALQSMLAPQTCCNNGKRDPGEECDTAIPAGSEGACPTDCRDSDPCTIDSIVGSACSKHCEHKPQTSPLNGDGCCPAGATGETDSDCGVGCGNGALEAGETCDPAIKVGPGRCKTLEECTDYNTCTVDTLAGSGCDIKCVNTPKPADPVKSDGCCPARNMSKSEDIDCRVFCDDPDAPDDCYNPCGSVTCPEGEYCTGGVCKVGTNPNPDNGENDETGNAGGCACNLAQPRALVGTGLLIVLLAMAWCFERRRRY